MVTTANANFIHPLRSPWVEWWNTTLSAQTVSIPILTDNVTLTDAEVKVEVEVLNTSGVPLGALVDDGITDPVFGTPANQTTDGVSSWASAPGTPVMQTLDKSVTPAENGLIRARVVLAKASTTLYFDPKVPAASIRQYMSEAGLVNEGAPPIGHITGARSIGTY